MRVLNLTEVESAALQKLLQGECTSRVLSNILYKLANQRYVAPVKPKPRSLNLRAKARAPTEDNT